MNLHDKKGSKRVDVPFALMCCILVDSPSARLTNFPEIETAQVKMCMRSCADQINGVVDDGAATPKKCLRLDYSDLSSYELFVFCGTTGSLLVPKGFTFVGWFRTNVRTP